jgi:UDP-N-acetylglucosamine 2-epimerase (non-hydrolysing)
VGVDPDRIVEEGLRALNTTTTRGPAPEFWDGRAAERIIDVLAGARAPGDTLSRRDKTLSTR